MALAKPTICNHHLCIDLFICVYFPTSYPSYIIILVSEANKKLQDTNDHIQGMVDMPSLGGNSPMPSRRSLQVRISLIILI